MRLFRLYSIALIIFLGVVFALRPSRALGSLQVVAVSPAARTLVAPTNSAVAITFDRPVDSSTINSDSFRVFGRWSGAVSGTYAFSDGNQTVTLIPDEPFSAGEQVMVILANTIQAEDDTFLRSAGYSYQFWTATETVNAEFELLDVLSTLSHPGDTTRAYGGVGSDFNNDGWMDLGIINEVSADVRVFVNTADGTGNYYDFLTPPAPVNTQASPNEPGDFNNDGNTDLVVGNIDTASLSVLLGNGDGTFDAPPQISVGPYPRGVAVLDADGDGDMDIANTNSGGVNGNLSLLLNNGDGTFAEPVYFDGQGQQEWAMATADMNEDGIMDLVVGTQSYASPQILVHLGNGDGSFTFLAAYPAGGPVWMINTGDLNGDGHDDVATANSGGNSGSILLNDGAGHLSTPLVTPTDSLVLSTRIGDVDGDGDLDWVLSSYFGDWRMFINDGAGNFSAGPSFPSSAAASCAVLLDFDNDGDLDLALIDEIADEVVLMKNVGEPGPPPITPTPSVMPTGTSTATATPTAVFTSTPTAAPTATPTAVPLDTQPSWLPIIIRQDE